jgi:hypothetical protein
MARSLAAVAQDAGEFRYTGGSTFQDTLPGRISYAELMARVNEKAGVATSIRYLTPGEPLDPDALVSVLDDADLQVTRHGWIGVLEEEMLGEQGRRSTEPHGAAQLACSAMQWPAPLSARHVLSHAGLCTNILPG